MNGVTCASGKTCFCFGPLSVVHAQRAALSAGPWESSWTLLATSSDICLSSALPPGLASACPMVGESQTPRRLSWGWILGSAKATLLCTPPKPPDPTASDPLPPAPVLLSASPCWDKPGDLRLCVWKPCWICVCTVSLCSVTPHTKAMWGRLHP